MSPEKTRWWGWGATDRTFDLSRRPGFWPHLKRRLNIPEQPCLRPPRMEEIDPPARRIKEFAIQSLQKILPGERIHLSKEERLCHTYGKSYQDLIRIRHKIFTEVPDAVLYPESEAEIQGILSWASERRIGVIPRGGGTSVVGGVEALRSPDQSGLVVIDLKRMNRILGIHRNSLLADVQAGIYGPRLEEALQAEGLTLGHYPESFEYSTLGGWIAARSAGQQSTRYGKIEEMVQSLRVVTPTGIIQTSHFPASASGPDLNQTLIGSEGILGIISQACVKLKPIPRRKHYTAFLFRRFEDGLQALREIIQGDFYPATLRLSDAEETDFVFSMQERHPSALRNKIQFLGLRWLEKRGFHPGQRAFLILGLEGSRRSVEYEWKGIKNILNPFSPFHLGERVGQAWYRHRFENPYLRDILLDYGLLVDTLETATVWENLQHLYIQVRDTILNTYKKLGIQGVVMAHLSHVYPGGSSLYFILLATPHPQRELEEWWTIKKAACHTIVNTGGTISHHHGIGLDHRSWLKHEIGESGIAILRNMKRQIDPHNILNPGKLLPEE